MTNGVRCPSCGHDWLIEERHVQVDAGIRVVANAAWYPRKERIVYRCASCTAAVEPDRDDHGHTRTPRWQEGDEA